MLSRCRPLLCLWLAICLAGCAEYQSFQDPTPARVVREVEANTEIRLALKNGEDAHLTFLYVRDGSLYGAEYYHPDRIRVFPLGEIKSLAVVRVTAGQSLAKAAEAVGAVLVFSAIIVARVYNATATVKRNQGRP